MSCMIILVTHFLSSLILFNSLILFQLKVEGTFGEFIKIPSKTIHMTSALIRTVNLTFEIEADDTIVG